MACLLILQESIYRGNVEVAITPIWYIEVKPLESIISVFNFSYICPIQLFIVLISGICTDKSSITNDHDDVRAGQSLTLNKYLGRKNLSFFFSIDQELTD